MIAANTLSDFPNVTRQRAERFSFDIEISVGWMHSGYPIGAYISALNSNLLRPDELRQDGTWGAFHEIGHNVQWRDWTISKTTETGCNWWSIYMNQVNERFYVMW